MRVLHVNASLDPVTGGGTAERTASLCRALSALGVHTSVLTLDIGLEPQVRAGLADMQVEALRCVSRRFYVPQWAPRRIRSAVVGADVVHLMGHWTVLNALAYQAAWRTGTPYVVCPAGALPVFGRSGRGKRAYNAVVGRRLVRSAAAHVAITEAERADFAAYGVAPDSVAVVPNGVSPEAFADPGEAAQVELRARLGDDPRPYLLFVGRLNPIKGPDLLLEAAAAVRDRLGDLRIVLAGPDEGMRAALEAQAVNAGLGDRVVFMGPVQGPVKVAAYREARMLVVPSRQEAMSLVAVEAGASGTPVLLTAACGFPEAERVGGGRVVPATAEGLADGLRALLAEPAQLTEMGCRLQRLVLADYTWDRAAHSYLNLYRSLVPQPCDTTSTTTEGWT